MSSEAGRYRKKPVEVEAVQCLNGGIPRDFLRNDENFHKLGDGGIIVRRNGKGRIAEVPPGDWLIREPNGWLITCWQLHFAETYEPADQPEQHPQGEEGSGEREVCRCPTRKLTDEEMKANACSTCGGLVWNPVEAPSEGSGVEKAVEAEAERLFEGHSDCALFWSELPDAEKEGWRKEVRRTLAAIQPFLAQPEGDGLSDARAVLKTIAENSDDPSAQAEADACLARFASPQPEKNSGDEEKRLSFDGTQHTGKPESFESWSIAPRLRQRLFGFADELDDIGGVFVDPIRVKFEYKASALRSILNTTFDAAPQSNPEAPAPVQEGDDA